jgi:hypothetical protein
MFGSPDAYNSAPVRNKRHDNRLKNESTKMGPPIPKAPKAAPYVAKPAAKDSPYYYGTDSTYTPTPKVRIPEVKQVRPQYDIGLDGIPRAVPSTSTTKAEPTQNPTRPVQSTGGEEVPAFSYYDQARKANPDGGTRNFGEGYKEAELEAGQKAENSRAGAGFGGQTRVSPTGVVQKGTSTSPAPMTMDDANKLLSGGYKVENPYSSNQLPYTQSSPYAGKSNSQIYNPETLHQHDSDVDYVKLSKDIYGDQSGVELSTRNGGMKADYKQMDVNPGEKMPEEKVNWANRTMADNSDEKVRRRSAFLDPNVNIMQAMRNQEAIQGRVYAGGKHYQRNKNAGQEGENDFVEISADQARDRSYYRQSADEVFANHLGKAKETVASSDIPDLPKNTPAMLPDAVPNDTSMDKSPFDTEELMQQKPGKSIIGNNTPYTSANPATLYR